MSSTREIPALGASEPGRAFLNLVADKLGATERLLGESLASEVPFVEEAGAYIFDGGGKRMRPALLLLVARMLGLDGDEEVTYAATVELVHTATLVHDDMIDQADSRRGKDSVHRLWGNQLTVLLGDWLYTTAMRMALRHGKIEVVRRLCDATQKMIEGELLGAQQLGSPDLSRDDYFRIIELKTAHLFSAAASIPSCIDPAFSRFDASLQSYGRHLGISFQLVDDLLDFTANPSEVGKPVLSDLKEGKVTLPVLLLLPRLDPAQRGLVVKVLDDRSFDRVAPEQILELVREHGTLDETRELAGRFAVTARGCLEDLPSGAPRTALQLAPDFVLHRRS